MNLSSEAMKPILHETDFARVCITWQRQNAAGLCNGIKVGKFWVKSDNDEKGSIKWQPMEGSKHVQTKMRDKLHVQQQVTWPQNSPAELRRQFSTGILR